MSLMFFQNQKIKNALFKNEFRISIFYFIFFIFLGANVSLYAFHEGNLLLDSGFEQSEYKDKSEVLCRNWHCVGTVRNKESYGELSDDAHSGSSSLRLVLRGENADFWCSQTISVLPGARLIFSLWGKGEAGRRFFVQFTPVGLDNKKKKTTYTPFILTEQWKRYQGNYTIPDGCTRLICIIHMFGKAQTALFDDFDLRLAKDRTLLNRNLLVTINPDMGGGIVSLTRRKSKNICGIGSHSKRLLGGLALDILFGKDSQYPGIFATGTYWTNIEIPFRKVTLSRCIGTGMYAGLRLEKTYELSEEAESIRVSVKLSNTGRKPMSLTYRVQNFLRPEEGYYSFPLRDWLSFFCRDSEAIRSVNSLVQNELRHGWAARTYRKHCGLLFQFDNNQVQKVYDYFDSDFDTLEWYYRNIDLAAGKSWRTTYTVSGLESVESFHTGNVNYGMPPVEIKGVKMPPVKTEYKESSSLIQKYFPFGATLANVTGWEIAGSKEEICTLIYERQIREMADLYFNHFYSAQIYSGKEEILDVMGRSARKYHMTFSPNIWVVEKGDVEVLPYRKKKRDNLTQRISPLIRKKLCEYRKNILCYFTGDEITAQNVSCMLLGHEILREACGQPDAVCFPYLNLAATIYEVAKYLPVYLGDLYPVYQKAPLTRNPWRVSPEVRDFTTKFPDTPFWIMTQGFGSVNGIYGTPRPEELRLMVYSAVGAGAKGVIFYGLNGMGRWIRKGGGEQIPLQTAAGSRHPAMDVVRECGRELTAIGPRLLNTQPDEDSAALWKVQGPEIRKISRKTIVYKGPAVTAHVLARKSDGINFLVLINQDDLQSHKIRVSPPDNLQALYNLTRMVKENYAGTLELVLRPGDAVFFVYGAVEKVRREKELVFDMRFVREKARCLPFWEMARNNGLSLPNMPSGTGEEAYWHLMHFQKKAREQIAASDFGKILKQWRRIGMILGECDYHLIYVFDRIIPVGIQKQTQFFKAYPELQNTPEQRLRLRFISHVYNYRRLDRDIENGKWKTRKQEITKLMSEIEEDAALLRKLLPLEKPVP